MKCPKCEHNQGFEVLGDCPTCGKSDWKVSNAQGGSTLICCIHCERGPTEVSCQKCGNTILGKWLGDVGDHSHYCANCEETIAAKVTQKWVGSARGDYQDVGHCTKCGKKLYGPDCFIATAAYGTPFTIEIDHLRQWRDNTLTKTSTGRFFIDAYYLFSPPMAKIISRFRLLRFITRLSLKLPIIYLKNKNQIQICQRNRL